MSMMLENINIRRFVTVQNTLFYKYYLNFTVFIYNCINPNFTTYF